jgi:inner membrane protein
VLAIAAAVLAIALNLSSSGGPTAFVGNTLGLRVNAVDKYQQNSASNHVWAEISGTFATDSSRADGKYFLVAADGNEFIVSSQKGQIYKTGENIISDRLIVEVGKPASSSVQSLEFDEEEFSIVPIPNAAVFISGEVLVDDPELVKIGTDSKQFTVAKLTGDRLTFTYCPLEKALALLKDQIISGSIQAKIFSPKP